MTLAQPGKFREEAQGAAVAGAPSAGGKRSWLAILRQGSAGGVQKKSSASTVSPWAPAAHKPIADMADLFLMGTLDQKAPPVVGGAGGVDLLDTLVQSDLLRAQSELAAENARPTEQPPVAALAEDTAGAEQTAMLQKEIDLLLDNDGTAVPEGAGEPAGAAEQAFRAGSVQDSALSESAVAEAANLSAAEVNALLSTETAPAEATAAARPTIQTAKMPQYEDETARQLSEAEGVLAAELAQLMAEGPADTKNNDLAVIHEAIKDAEKPPEAAPLAETAVVAAIPAPSSVHETAPAAASPPSPGDSNSLAAPAADVEEGSRRGFFGDIALMVAQLVDMPFAWIHEMDKNVIGFAAFLLLMSGLVLKILSWLYS